MQIYNKVYTERYCRFPFIYSHENSLEEFHSTQLSEEFLKTLYNYAKMASLDPGSPWYDFSSKQNNTGEVLINNNASNKAVDEKMEEIVCL